MRQLVLALAIASVITSSAHPAAAQPVASPPAAAPQAAVTPLPAAPPAVASPDAPAASRPEVVVAAGKGLTVTNADKTFQMTLRARAQLRETFQRVRDPNTGETNSTNEVSVRTLRFSILGYALVPELKYLIQLALGAGDFENGNPSPIFDAFLEYTKLRDLNVRFGQYFVPFDRARTIREFALQFVDRQIVVRELNLDRDVGLMFYSNDLFGWGTRLGYNLYVGAGDGKNRVNDTIVQKPSVLVVARLALRPFGAFDDDQEADLTRGAKPRLAVGVAGGYNKATSRDRSTHGAVYQRGTFDYAHAAADLVFKWHGFSLLAEGMLRQANRDRNQFTADDGSIVTEYSRSGFGYLVQAGQMVHQKVEVTARWDDLHNRKGTDPKLVSLVDTMGRQLGAGLNVYLNGHYFKFQTDYFYIFGEHFDQPNHSFRVQVDATF
jgi:phosphate-selective porin OprO/OprP